MISALLGSLSRFTLQPHFPGNEAVAPTENASPGLGHCLLLPTRLGKDARLPRIALVTAPRQQILSQ